MKRQDSFCKDKKKSSRVKDKVEVRQYNIGETRVIVEMVVTLLGLSKASRVEEHVQTITSEKNVMIHK